MATQWDTRAVAESDRAQAPWNRSAESANGSSGASKNGGDGLARSLGWFSIGLGLAEVLAPKQIAKLTGTRNHTGWIRAYGIREIVSGVGILTNPNPAPWLWSRVGGDILDLASLGAALALMEKAAVVLGSRHTRRPVAIAGSERVDLLTPVSKGQLLEVGALVLGASGNQVSVEVNLDVEELLTGTRRHVTRGQFSLVVIDDAGTTAAPVREQEDDDR